MAARFLAAATSLTQTTKITRASIPTGMRTRSGAYNGDDSSSGLSSPPSYLELTDDDSADGRPIVSGFFKSEPDPWKKKPKEVVEAVKREPTPSLGDIVPALAGKRGKRRAAAERKPRDKKKVDVKAEAPEHWEEMYNAVKEMRSRVPAPVDTMGCERLADDAPTPKVDFPFSQFLPSRSLILSIAKTIPNLDIIDAFEPDKGHGERGSDEGPSDEASRGLMPRKHLGGGAKTIGRAH